VLALTTRGDTLWSRSYSYGPRKLEQTTADSFVVALQRSIARSGHSKTPAEIRALAFVPEYRTPITSGVAATDGSLWLRREEGRPTVDHWVIGESGDLVASVSIPRNVTVKAVAGSAVWVVETDLDDVPHVVKYTIMR
jgi:hypothetical protein